MFKCIVVPLDGSAIAEAALPTAKALARAFGAEIHLVHVQEDPVYFAAEAAPTSYFELLAQTHASMRNYMHGVATAINGEGIRAHVAWSSDRPVDAAIVGEAKRVAADLIVIATHGRGGIARVMLGSVADRIVHSVDIPVLMVRPDDREYPK